MKDQTQYNPAYVVQVQLQEPQPYTREVHRESNEADELQGRDGRPPSPQPGPSGLRRNFNRAKRQRNCCVATVGLEIMKSEELYDEINESEMMNDDTTL